MIFRTVSRSLFSFLTFFLIISFSGRLSAQDEWGRLQNFEDGDLSRWELAGQGTMALDSTYATQRKRNLRVEFGQGSALRVSLKGIWRMEEIIREKFSDEGGGGWKIYEAFFTDIYAPRTVEILITFRDSLGGVWQRLTPMKKGLNHLQFRSEELKGVDFNSLASVEYAPAVPCTLYFDHIRTWEYQPELDQRGKMDIVFSDSVESPHVDWQRPDAAGPVRGLFVPTAGASRAMVELMQRFDLQPTTVIFEPSLGLHRWAFGDFYGTRALGYDHVTDKFTISYTYITSELESDKPFDVIVLPPMRGAQNWPDELKRVLLKRVAAGCGLVLFQPSGPKEAAWPWELSPLDGEVLMERYKKREADQDEERPGGARTSGPWQITDPRHYIARGLPLGLVPTQDIQYLPYSADKEARVIISSAAGNPILATGSYGKGRVAAVAWVDVGLFPNVNEPLDEKNGLPYWEYIYALIGRTVRWAAGKDSTAGIFAPSIERDPVKGGLRLTAELRGTLPGDMINITFHIGEWQNCYQATLPVKGDGKFEHRWPELPSASLVIADIRHIRAGGGIVDFASAAREFDVEASLASLEVDRATLSLGEQATGMIRLEGGPARVAVSLTDNRDRLLAADTLLTASGAESRFSLPTDRCLTRRAVVTARVLSEASMPSGRRAVLNSRSIALFVNRPAAWDDYEVIMYRFMPDILPGEWKFLDRYMESLGATAWAGLGPELTFLSNLGIQAETRLDTEESLDGEGEKPYRQAKAMYLKTRDKKYLHRLHCMHDPSYLEEQKRTLNERINAFKRFSPLSYYIYEEPSYTHYGDALDLCTSPYCMAAFREELKEQYGSLEALDKQWGTGFKTWDSVIPDDTFEAQARGNYSSWADHRTFAEITYAGNYAYVRQIVRSIDPNGLVMMTGTQRTVPQNGYDYYLLDQTIDHTQPYGEPERHKAFMRQGGKITGCTGYGVFGPKLAYEIWSRLFYGHTAGSAIFWQFSTIDPDYRLCKSGRDMMDIFSELRHGGIARLVASAEWTPSEVVLFWSMPSIHGTWIQDGRIIEADGAPSKIFDRWEFNYESWRWLLEDLGVPYRAMSYQMLDQGWLLDQKNGARILVLPNTIAISEKGIRDIERFVSQGGVVIGDAQVALMDGHCKWLKTGALDKLFGTEGARCETLPVGDNTVQRGQNWGLRTADEKTRAAGAEEIDLGGGLPTVYRKTSGSGEGYYLNAFMAGYGRLRQEDRGTPVREAAARLLDKAGYKPLIEIKPASGDDLKAIKIVSYDLGQQGFLVGLIKDYRVPEPPRDIEIILPASGYNYDVRTKRYLGSGRSVHTTIATGEIKLLASLPYAVAGLRIELPESVKAGEEVSFTVEVEAFGHAQPLGPHVFRLEVFDPQGRKAGCYGGNLPAPGGRAQGSFYTALNDQSGRWSVRVSDVASGVTARKYLTVRQ
ncbi:MAG TPA: beta-galactosidase [archaeon]|nr:beta-galactosidase [archaeon]